MKLVKLSEICKLVGGGTPSKANSDFYLGEIPWATVRDLRNRWLENTEHKINPTAVRESSTNVIPSGNVVLASRVGLGKVVQLKQDTAINQDLRALIPRENSNIDSNYLYYWALSITPEIIAAGKGATVQGVTLPFLENLEIPLPSLEKQREIVEKLDQAFAEIDRLFENSLVSLNSVKSLTGGLVDSWIKTVSTGQTAQLSDLAELKGRIGWRGLTAREYTKSGPLFLSVHSLNHGHFVDFSRAFHISQDRYDESPEIHLKEGYILIAKDGAGLGKVAMVGAVTEPTTVNSSLLVVKPKKEIKTKYLYCYFLSPDFKKLIADRLGGSTVPHLYQRDIAKIPIALLTPKQQVEFIEKFDVGSNLLENLSRNLERRLSLITQLKESILAVEFEAVA